MAYLAILFFVAVSCAIFPVKGNFLKDWRYWLNVGCVCGAFVSGYYFAGTF